MEEENHIPKEAFITDSSWRAKIRDNKNKIRQKKYRKSQTIK